MYASEAPRVAGYSIMRQRREKNQEVFLAECRSVRMSMYKQYDCYLECNYPMNTHARLLVGWSVRSFGRSVIISLKGIEVTIP